MQNEDRTLLYLKTVLKNFEEVAIAQEKKGLEKYGQPVNPMDGYDWLKMAMEEFVDGIKYLTAEQIKREKALQDIYNQLSETRERIGTRVGIDLGPEGTKKEIEKALKAIRTIQQGYTNKREEKKDGK